MLNVYSCQYWIAFNDGTPASDVQRRYVIQDNEADAIAAVQTQALADHSNAGNVNFVGGAVLVAADVLLPSGLSASGDATAEGSTDVS